MCVCAEFLTDVEKDLFWTIYDPGVATELHRFASIKNFRLHSRMLESPAFRLEFLPEAAFNVFHLSGLVNKASVV